MNYILIVLGILLIACAIFIPRDGKNRMMLLLSAAALIFLSLIGTAYPQTCLEGFPVCCQRQLDALISPSCALCPTDSTCVQDAFAELGENRCISCVPPMPTRTPRVSKEKKRLYTNIVTAIKMTAGSLGALQAICSINPPAKSSCNLVITSALIGMGAVATRLQFTLDNDPPDENYWDVFEPVFERPPRVRRQLIQALLNNEAWIAALVEALAVSIDRVNTAASHGATEAERLQQGAIDTLVDRLDERFQREADLRVRVVAWFARFGIDLGSVADQTLIAALSQ